MIKFKRSKVNFSIFLLVIVVFSLCFAETVVIAKTQISNKNTRVVVDMQGRKVTIPKEVKKVVALSNNATVYVYTLAPDKLLGWSFNPKPEAKKFIKDKYFNLPNLGSSNQKTSSYENILKLKPDLVICSNEDEVYKPDQIQKQLNIPVVMVNVSLDETDKVYNFLGNCLNESKRGKLLADYSRKILNNIKKLTSKIPKEKRLNVYYAEGPAWLQTDISKNVHTEVLDLVNGKNVADISEDKVGSMAAVSMEQVLAWDPDVILVGATAAKGDFYSKVYSDETWGEIKAVKNKKIYKIPSLPFNWFDRPPCSARILGAEWLANLLYPNYVKLDLKTEIKNFYQLFYNYKITDEDIKKLLENATN